MAHRALDGSLAYQSGETAYLSDPDLDRTALARANLQVMLERGFPVSVILQQLGGRKGLLSLCEWCAREKPTSDRRTCASGCARALAAHRRRQNRTAAEPLEIIEVDGLCQVCSVEIPSGRKCCSKVCAGSLTGRWRSRSDGEEEIDGGGMTVCAINDEQCSGRVRRSTVGADAYCRYHARLRPPARTEWPSGTITTATPQQRRWGTLSR